MDNEDLRKIPNGVLILDEINGRPPFRLTPEQLEDLIEGIKKNFEERNRHDNP